MDFVSYDSQNISSWVLITDQIHKFGLSELRARIILAMNYEDEKFTASISIEKEYSIQIFNDGLKLLVIEIVWPGLKELVKSLN